MSVCRPADSYPEPDCPNNETVVDRHSRPRLSRLTWMTCRYSYSELLEEGVPLTKLVPGSMTLDSGSMTSSG